MIYVGFRSESMRNVNAVATGWGIF
jgi:hypothetical protein